MAQHSGGNRRLTVEEFTELLAEDLGEDPEAIQAHAEKFELEPPWEAEFEEVEGDEAQ